MCLSLKCAQYWHIVKVKVNWRTRLEPMFVKNIIQLHGLNLVNEIYEFDTQMYFKKKCFNVF